MATTCEMDRKTVLVVDDEAEIRQFVCRILRKYFSQYSVEQAIDGLDGSRKVVDLSPQLVILDLRMPGMSGQELAQLIQEHPWLYHTKILVITGYPSPQARQTMFNRGANEFLAKPFGLYELVTSIGRLLP